MKKKCNIFICYRDDNVLLAKNFALFIEKINKDINDKRNFGEVWYSDLQPEGNYLNANEIEYLINSAKYFVVFLFKGFTKGFLTKDGEINPNCATAQEFIYAEKARQKTGLKFIFVNMNSESFSQEDVKNLKHLFEKAGILKADTINAFIKGNRNNHDLRQGKDNDLYERLLKCIEPYIEDSVKYKTINDVPDSISEKDIRVTVRKYVQNRTLINEEWDNEISSEFFVLCLAKELRINKNNPQYIELIQRVSERLTKKVDTGEYSIEQRHNKKVFEETDQIIELMKKDDDNNGEYRHTAYAADKINGDIRFFYNYFNALFTKIKSIDDRFDMIAVQSAYTLKSLFENESFEDFGGWKLYRLPWITARVLLCLSDVNLNQEQITKIKEALQSLIDRQKGDGTWYSGASEWVPEWESTGLCLEALFVYGYDKFKKNIDKTINHYLPKINDLLSAINYSSDADASNRSTAIIILLSVIYQVLKKYRKNDFANIEDYIRKGLYLAIEQIQSQKIKGKQHSCVPCALYYIIKAVGGTEENE